MNEEGKRSQEPTTTPTASRRRHSAAAVIARYIQELAAPNEPAGCPLPA